jgi:hypothetical protein
MCENKIKNFNENSKMFLYKKLKLNLEREFYLSYNNSDIRRGFTKIRIREHNLEIEKRRYCKIPRILRLDFTSFKFLKLEVLSKMFWSEVIFLTNVNHE